MRLARRSLLGLLATVSGIALLPVRAARAQGSALPPGAFPVTAAMLVPETLFGTPTGRFRVDPARGPAPPPAAGRLARPPVIDPRAKGPAAEALRVLARRGLAAGLGGVLYDNRDRGHSALPPGLFPALARTAYGPELRAKTLDYGLAGRLVFPAATIGNSSTAITRGPLARSLPRLAMTEPGGPARAYAGYAGNALYVYPANADHDAVDRYPANWPAMLVSQGASHSDMPLLRALALALAALAPDTRAALEAEGRVAPTLQMLVRRAMPGTRTEADYLSGPAHPSVFAGGPDETRLVALAQALRPETVPPVVRLAVVAEDFSARFDPGMIAPEDTPGETLFDTPAAIARLWRAPAWRRHATLAATAPGATDIAWVCLRGDPAHVAIRPAPDGTRAEITLDWHDRRPIDPDPIDPDPIDADPGRLTDRVDIGAFARRGDGMHGAPAFFTVSFPAHEIRRFEPDPAVPGTLRTVSIDYDAIGRGAAFDPMLHASAPWTDRYAYDAAGGPSGFVRRVQGGAAAAWRDATHLADGTPMRLTRRRDRRGRTVLGVKPAS